ncbi:MAG: molybdenum cofactor guanylyltransferase [Leptolyngbya sp. SIOISBB]|nr:molybdenum cofactor guanylyltransferase [Leptolyngbya sp. SIOISBB]
MKLAGLILAGGRSQRMGQDKALLEIGGVPLLRQTWEVADSLTPDVWVVTPYRDRYAALLPAKTQWIDELLPADATPPPGPLVAFGQALPMIEADWILLLACDLPNLQVEALRQWFQVLPGLSADAIAYVPKTAQGWEPLCGFYRRSCLSSLREYLTTGKRSFQTWLNQSSVVPISDVPVGLLANCNTPADWQRLTKR